MAIGLHSSARGRRARAPMAEINVTPLVDVMLVLLIIFMVTAPLLVAGVPVDLPESRAGALPQEAEPLQLTLDERGRTFLNETPVTTAQLPARLAQAASGSTQEGGPRVYLRAHRSLPYERVMAVMGELNRAGLRRVALVSVEGADG